jgi:tellurite resistance protein
MVAPAQRLGRDVRMSALAGLSRAASAARLGAVTARPRKEEDMPLSPQEALIYLMVVTASADTQMSERELKRIDELIRRLPVFKGYDPARLSHDANSCVDLINAGSDIDRVLDMAIEALPARLQDTAYALAVEIAAVDLKLEQAELRFLEEIRDRLELDRLITAAIEAAARARYRHG